MYICSYVHTYIPCVDMYILCILLLLPVALVNKGNCLFSSGQYDKAHDYYQEALRFVLDTSGYSYVHIVTYIIMCNTYM